ILGGANTSAFIVRKFNSPSTWTATTTGPLTATSSQGTGISSFSDFAVGEPCNPPTLSTIVTNASCNGGINGAITLSTSGGSTPFTYSWSNSATTQNISSLIAGTYTVTVTANGG